MEINSAGNPGVAALAQSQTKAVQGNPEAAPKESPISIPKLATTGSLGTKINTTA